MLAIKLYENLTYSQHVGYSKYVVFKALLVLLQYIVHIDIFICAIALTEPEITLIDQIRALKHTLVL